MKLIIQRLSVTAGRIDFEDLARATVVSNAPRADHFRAA